MKYRIYILLLLTLLSFFWFSVDDFKEGFQAGYENIHAVRVEPVHTADTEYVINSVFLQMEKSRSGIIWNLLEGFLGFFLAIAILCSMVCFVRILWSVRKKKIFIRQNVYRMRIISYTLIIYILFLGVSDFFACQSTMQFFDMPGYRMSTYKFPLGSLLIGLLIAVVTEIYAQGVRMEEEQDLTV